MKKIKVFELFSTFSDSEAKEFSKFIQSGFIRGSRDYTPIFNALLNLNKVSDRDSVTLKTIYMKAYPDGEYNNRVIISRLSELNKIAEEFLILKRCRVNKHLRNIALNEELEKRKLFPACERLLDKSIASYNTKPFLSKTEMLELDRYCTAKRNLLSQENRYPEVLDILIENANLFYSFGTIHVLDLFITIQNTLSFHNPRLDIKKHKNIIENINFPKIITELKNTNQKTSQLLEVYYLLFRLNNYGNKKKTYQLLKKIFYKIVFFLPRETRSGVFSHMYHFCLNIINRGRSTLQQEFNLELYDLLKKIIETDSYSSSEDEYLSLYLFREFVLSGINGKKYSEVENFIKLFGEKLNPDARGCMIHFGYARLYFVKNKFRESLNHLKKINLKSYVIRFDVTYHTLACYYELDRIEEALLMADSTRHYLVSINDFNNSVMERLHDFLGVYRKLITQKLNPNRRSLESLKALAAKSKYIYFPGWINEKINELLRIC